MKVYLASLGCARNQVDSEVMLGRLEQRGWHIIQDPEDAHVIIVNTCSFIESAVDESIDTILALADYKNTGACEQLIVTGCLPERYGKDIVATLPEVDFFLGTGAFGEIDAVIGKASSSQKCLLPAPEKRSLAEENTPRHAFDTHMAYIKIAEGCNSRCTYCIIPKLRGNHRSRPLADIISESKRFVSSGVRELILVAQDSTNYGMDLDPPLRLSFLLDKLSQISKEIWVRFLYGHPEHFDSTLIEVVAARDNLCPYFDIPIQHVSQPVLRRMGRHYDQDHLMHLFSKIREQIPHAALRTSVMVGFPGETDDDILQLLQFIETVRFDHLGVFIYSDDKDLPSHGLKDHIAMKVAQERFDRIMSRQREISLDRNQAWIGSTQKVLIEQCLEPNLYAARTRFQAPEVDGLTFVHTDQRDKSVSIGDFKEITITEALEYDLVGKTRTHNT